LAQGFVEFCLWPSLAENLLTVMVCWQVIGGADNGGILVRLGKELKSPLADGRLATGAIVKETALEGERLNYELLKGAGPSVGWVSLSLKGKNLVTKVEDGEADTSETAGDATTTTDTTTDGERPFWIEESIKAMQAFRDGEKVLPAPPVIPERLQGEDPRNKLLPFKRLNHDQMAQMSPKNLPGCLSDMKFPHTSEQLKSFGPDWYTKAFHYFGTLPKDNRVTKIVKVQQLPHSGFDAAGGAGHKAFITLEYEKKDINLHTELFAKFPWDYFESEIGKQYRMQISTYADMDSAEVMTSLAVEHLLPFRIPKFYYGDINRDTTNWILIVEKIPFGRRGKVVNGKVVEKIERKPFDVLPVCGKYQDYLLDDPPKIYYALFRTMAHLAAWDHLGRYESLLGPRQTFTYEEFLVNQGNRKPKKKSKQEMSARGARNMMGMGTDFSLNTAPWLFTAGGRDKKKVEKMTADIAEIAPYFDDIRAFLGSSSDYIAAMHMNLQADNAYFWPDEHGDYDVGVFDWCGFNRTIFVQNFNGCLAGADADLIAEHDEGIMTTFCKEYERYGGPSIPPKDLLLRYHLGLPAFIMDCCQWVERDVYVETPKAEWKGIKSIFDEKFIGRWNTRCRTTTLINAFDLFPRRNFKKIVDDWKSSVDPRVLSKFVD